MANHLKTGLFPLIALALCACLLCGCAASKASSSSLTLEEVRKLHNAAKFTEAAVKSPYEFYSAEIFLKKAADELSLGNDKVAQIYLRKAYQQSKIAYDNAKRYQRAQ